MNNDDNVAFSNSEFELRVSDSSDFMGSTKKDGTAKCASTATSCRPKENNATAYYDKEKEFMLTPEEIVRRMSKLLFQKMKYRINHNVLIQEETNILSNDEIGNNKHTQQGFNRAKKIFAIVL